MSATTYGPEDFQAATDVSRETLDRLRTYADLLRRWQGTINLVGPKTLDDLWRRHMLDSAQLLPMAPGARSWIDLGSGAGFPGLVLAILGAPEVHLIESNARKCAFLREAARLSGVVAKVHNARIEALEPWPTDAVVARALAPLGRLLELAVPFCETDSVCLFPKGLDVENELTEATKYWKMKVERHVSASNPAGTVLRLTEVSRV